jgi:8-oxo-dGDP phosphatase
VSGGIDSGENPLEAAQRELKEESGLEAKEWIDLGTVNSLAMLIDCTMHLFLAKGLIRSTYDSVNQDAICSCGRIGNDQPNRSSSL